MRKFFTSFPLCIFFFPSSGACFPSHPLLIATTHTNPITTPHHRPSTAVASRCHDRCCDKPSSLLRSLRVLQAPLVQRTDSHGGNAYLTPGSTPRHQCRLLRLSRVEDTNRQWPCAATDLKVPGSLTRERAFPSRQSTTCRKSRLLLLFIVRVADGWLQRLGQPMSPPLLLAGHG
jgi:hypothetical protein